MEVLVNETVHRATAGCTLWIPSNTNHSLFVTSQRVRGFCVITPGGFEKFFEDLGEPATVQSMPTHQTRMPSPEEFMEVGAKYEWKFQEPDPRPPELTGRRHVPGRHRHRRAGDRPAQYDDRRSAEPGVAAAHRHRRVAEYLAAAAQRHG